MPVQHFMYDMNVVIGYYRKPVEKTMSGTSSTEKTMGGTSSTEKTIAATSPTGKTLGATLSTEKTIAGTSPTGKTMAGTSSTGKTIAATSPTEKTLGETSSTGKTMGATSSTEKIISGVSPTEKSAVTASQSTRIYPVSDGTITGEWGLSPAPHWSDINEDIDSAETTGQMGTNCVFGCAANPLPHEQDINFTLPSGMDTLDGVTVQTHHALAGAIPGDIATLQMDIIITDAFNNATNHGTQEIDTVNGSTQSFGTKATVFDTSIFPIDISSTDSLSVRLRFTGTNILVTTCNFATLNLDLDWTFGIEKDIGEYST